MAGLEWHQGGPGLNTLALSYVCNATGRLVDPEKKKITTHIVLPFGKNNNTHSITIWKDLNIAVCHAGCGMDGCKTRVSSISIFLPCLIWLNDFVTFVTK